jgi:hypothetical protein
MTTTVLIGLGLADLGVIVAQSASELDALDRIADLDTPALLVALIVLLARGKLVWARELEACEQRAREWKAAAVGRAQDVERSAAIAEAAIRSPGA